MPIFLEGFEQKLLSFFPSDCVNGDVNHLVKILQQTFDEYTKYSEVTNKQKNCCCFDNSQKNYL